MRVVIIGAGASGILAALNINSKHEVIIIEANDKIGKKILVTGNGKCNFWNEEINIEKYNTDNQEKLGKILERKDEVLNYLQNNLGIHSFIKNGYYYPNSGLASSIQKVLTKAINKPNITIMYNTEVTSLEYNTTNIQLKLNDGTTILADKVIISTGGKAAPKTGSKGQGYSLLSNLDIKVNPIYPALVPLKTQEKFLNDWQGVRTHVALTVTCQDKIIQREKGEIQLTDYGISGIVTFNISSKVVKLLNENKKTTISIDFLPECNLTDILNNSHLNNHTIEEALETVLNYKLTPIILKRANISSNILIKNLNSQDKTNLESNIKNFIINITGYCDFEKAQVSTGGVSLNEINDTFALKKYPNIHLVGEILDIDGLCGGYNLAFAFISGYICGGHIDDKN